MFLLFFFKLILYDCMYHVMITHVISTYFLNWYCMIVCIMSWWHMLYLHIVAYMYKFQEWLHLFSFHLNKSLCISNVYMVTIPWQTVAFSFVKGMIDLLRALSTLMFLSGIESTHLAQATDNLLAFKSFNFESAWWKLF
jgi:hypothetical protein